MPQRGTTLINENDLVVQNAKSKIKSSSTQAVTPIPMIPKNKNRVAIPWLLVLVAVFAILATTTAPSTTFATTCTAVDDSYAGLSPIPMGPGQVCIKYYNRYTSLIDWSHGSILELSNPLSIAYDSVTYFRTVNSCVGSSSHPGALAEGDFFLLIGGIINQAAIVNIKKIDGNCPYQLTYYWLTNSIYCGPCQPIRFNTPNPDLGKTCPQVSVN